MSGQGLIFLGYAGIISDVRIPFSNLLIFVFKVGVIFVTLYSDFCYYSSSAHLVIL